jgi:hypothetical protein
VLGLRVGGHGGARQAPGSLLHRALRHVVWWWLLQEGLPHRPGVGRWPVVHCHQVCWCWGRAAHVQHGLEGHAGHRHGVGTRKGCPRLHHHGRQAPERRLPLLLVHPVLLLLLLRCWRAAQLLLAGMVGCWDPAPVVCLHHHAGLLCRRAGGGSSSRQMHSLTRSPLTMPASQRDSPGPKPAQAEL